MTNIRSIPADVRYAVRSFSRNPAFALTAILILALGIALNTVAFSLVNAVLLRPLPLPESERLVRLFNTGSELFVDEVPISYPDYEDYRQQSAGFACLAGYYLTPATRDGSRVETGFRRKRWRLSRATLRSSVRSSREVVQR